MSTTQDTFKDWEWIPCIAWSDGVKMLVVREMPANLGFSQ